MGAGKISALAIRGVEWLMGQRQFGKLCTALAKVGLRGLGVNLHHDLTRSGELFFLKNLLGRFPETVCFDVGANVGRYAAALLDSGAARVVAFEPVQATFELLERRLGARPSLTLVNAAVGETVGFVEVEVPAQSTLASRDLRLSPVSSAEHRTLRVPMTTLDAYVESSGVRPGFVKIDVEGFELEVLLGMKNLMALEPPIAIQFEFNQHHLKRKQSLLDFQAALPDFDLFRVASYSLRPLTPDHYLSNIYAYCNIVAVLRAQQPKMSFMW